MVPGLAILSAETIVCRSGYSTLLDLVVLGRTAVLVPTVGQPEQEGLAREWSQKHGWTTVQANDLATFAPLKATGPWSRSAVPAPSRSCAAG